MNEEDIKLIDRYLRKNLSKDDKLLWKERIKDELFREEFELSKVAFQAISLSENVNLKSQLTQLENETPYTKPNANNSLIYRLLFILLIFSIFGIAIYYFYSRTTKPLSPEEIYASYYHVPSNDVYPQTRSVAQSDLKKAFLNYDNGNYSTTIDILEKLPEENKSDVILYYLGHSYLAIDNINQAEQIFTKLTSIEGEYKEDAQWNLALIYIKKNDIEAASTLLKELKNKNYSADGFDEAYRSIVE